MTDGTQIEPSVESLPDIMPTFRDHAINFLLKGTLRVHATFETVAGFHTHFLEELATMNVFDFWAFDEHTPSETHGTRHYRLVPPSVLPH